MGGDGEEVRYEFLVEPLTPKQQAVLRVFVEHVRGHGTSPTYGDLGRLLGVNRSTVVEHVRKLEKKGYLSRDWGNHRALFLTDPHTGLRLRRDNARILPVVHSIEPSSSVAAHLDVRRDLPVPDHLLAEPDEPAFLLRVNNDAMARACLLRGDLAVVASRSTARKGQIAVALVSTEKRSEVAVIARYHSQPGRPVELLYEASPHRRIIRPVTCTIIGVITGSMRRFEDPPDQ